MKGNICRGVYLKALNQSQTPSPLEARGLGGIVLIQLWAALQARWQLSYWHVPSKVNSEIEIEL